jgi:hypothetical protein
MINLGIQSSCDEALYQVCLQNNPWSTLEYRAAVMKHCIRYVYKIIHDQPWNTELLLWSTCRHTWYSASSQELCIPRLIMDYFVDIPDTVLHHRSSVFQGWSWIMLWTYLIQYFITGALYSKVDHGLCYGHTWYSASSQELCIPRLIMDYFVDIPYTVLHHRSSVFQGWSWIMLWTYLIQCFITGALYSKVDHGLFCRHTWYSASSQELCIPRLIMDYFLDIPDTVLHHRSSVFKGWSWILELLWWSTVSGMSIT